MILLVSEEVKDEFFSKVKNLEVKINLCRRIKEFYMVKETPATIKGIIEKSIINKRNNIYLLLYYKEYERWYRIN